MKHTDIEVELIKNSTDFNKVISCSRNYSNFNVKKDLSTSNAFTQKKSQFYGFNKIQSCNNQRPLQESHSRVFWLQPNRPSVILKRNRVEDAEKIDPRITTKAEKPENLNSEITFPSEAFKRNLEKVVVEVLGKSTVKNSNECVINKPKTFMRRVNVGSGEQVLNSPSFYLPPRTFGCGTTKNSSPVPKDEVWHAPTPRPSSSFKISLPPFTKTTMGFSKSDGDLEDKNMYGKIGGSQESVKMNVRPWSQFPNKRPNVIPKRSLIVDKAF